MSRYQRVYVPGGCYFFTVVTAQRQPIFADVAAVDILREAFQRVKSKYPFETDAIVIMPDHLHCIWKLPAGDVDYSKRWRLVKTWFSKHHNLKTPLPTNAYRIRKKQKLIWQQRFWEHLIKDEEDYRNHVNYIHYNPVKHGLTDTPNNWLHSSFKSFVEMGLLAEDWGTSKIEIEEIIGME
jgi:putative transposase